MVLLAPLKNFENNNFQKHPKISSFLLVFMTYKLLCLSTKWLFLSCYHFSHQNVSFTASRWLYLKQKASQVAPLLKCQELTKVSVMPSEDEQHQYDQAPSSLQSQAVFFFSMTSYPKRAQTKSHVVPTLYRLFNQYIPSSMSTLLQHRELQGTWESLISHTQIKDLLFCKLPWTTVILSSFSAVEFY